MPPAAYIDLTEAARSVQVFKINGFSVTKEKPDGYTWWKVCTVGGHDWRIEFHPRLSSPSYQYTDWIMFRVRLISTGARDVAASFSCRLIEPSSPGGSYLDLEEITSAMFHENHEREVLLIRRTDLEGSQRQYVKNDCILVQCAINVLPGKPKDPAAAAAAKASLRVPSSDLYQQFGELLRSQKGADVTFLVAGERIPAHRSVLAARSPVFMAELLFGDDDTKEYASSRPCVVIDDMELEVFRAMLRFVYTDTVPELDLLKGEHARAMATRLLEAGERYGLKRLSRICVEKICRVISVDTVATTLALAERHGCSKLKAKCIKFTLANLGAVSATEGYKHLEAICPSVLTELLKLMVEGTRRV